VLPSGELFIKSQNESESGGPLKVVAGRGAFRLLNDNSVDQLNTLDRYFASWVYNQQIDPVLVCYLLSCLSLRTP